MIHDDFVPRPYPPPSLAGVPFEYVVDQLREFASQYWDQLHTTDCTIIVPIPSESATPLPCGKRDPLARRHTEPDLRVRQVKFSLHTDYLSTHSLLLRSLFSGASALHLIDSYSRITADPSNRIPRLLPSPSTHPALYLPVPDPVSIPLLFHWMYFGSTAIIQQSLDDGSVAWEGLARNVEYLQMSPDLERFLYDWWHDRRVLCRHCALENSEDSGFDSDHEDDDDDESWSSEEETSDIELDEPSPRDDIKHVPQRGRTTTIRFRSAHIDHY